MRSILIIFLFLAILCFAVIGTLYIFEVRTGDEALELLMKTEGVIFFLGGCSALVSTLLRRAKKAE